jgi:hypothetical protein
VCIQSVADGEILLNCGGKEEAHTVRIAGDVRFTPESGYVRCKSARPLRPKADIPIVRYNVRFAAANFGDLHLPVGRG